MKWVFCTLAAAALSSTLLYSPTDTLGERASASVAKWATPKQAVASTRQFISQEVLLDRELAKLRPITPQARKLAAAEKQRILNIKARTNANLMVMQNVMKRIPPRCIMMRQELDQRWPHAKHSNIVTRDDVVQWVNYARRGCFEVKRAETFF
jgi:hypothetical protein